MPNQTLKVAGISAIALFILNILWIAIGGTFIDESSFLSVDTNIQSIVQKHDRNSSDGDKANALVEAMVNQLEREMNSTFGWSVNDWTGPQYLDNRRSRQLGVIFATTIITNHFGEKFAKQGQGDKEPEEIVDARRKMFVYDARTWGFFVPSAETRFQDGIALMRQYARKVKIEEGKDINYRKTILNIRTDDLVYHLAKVSGDELMEIAFSPMLEAREKQSFFDYDDNLYYAQGVALVVRDFLQVLVKVYPEIEEKGGKENMQEALHKLDLICAFDPIFALKGSSGEINDGMIPDNHAAMYAHYSSVKKRLDDVVASIKN